LAIDLAFNYFSQSDPPELLISAETTPLSFRAAKIERPGSMLLAKIRSARWGVMSEASILRGASVSSSMDSGSVGAVD
jgi:hypothetical protein